MANPLISVVVPTRNRAQNLASCLKTCVSQKFSDYEIIVCDNFSDDATADVVFAAGNDRINYFRTPKPLAMSANWELALSKTRGTYIIFIGDDDGLMPYALREIARLIDTYNEPSAIHWRCGHYNWPTIAVASEADYLALPLARSIEVLNGYEQLLKAARQELSYDRLPSFYYAAVHRRLVDAHLDRFGRMFISICPDVYSAFAFSYLCGEYVSVYLPMHIAGLSGMSNGVATVMEPTSESACEQEQIAREFSSLNREAGFYRHATVPRTELLPAIVADSFQHAKDCLFPTDDFLTLDRKQMATLYLQAIPTSNALLRRVIKQEIRFSLEDRPELLEWYDGQPDYAPWSPFRKPSRLGFDGNFLLLNTKTFKIDNIADAINLAANILQVPDDGARYDLPSLSDAIESLTGQLKVCRADLIDRTCRLEKLLASLASRGPDT